MAGKGGEQDGMLSPTQADDVGDPRLLLNGEDDFGFHLIQRRFGSRILFRPNAVTPVNFLDCALIRHAVSKTQSPVLL